MRKLRKLRGISFPQAIAFVLIIAALAANASQAGAGNKIISEEIIDKYGNTVVVKTNSAELELSGLVAKHPEPSDNQRSAAVKSAVKLKLEQQIAFDKSVYAALGKMELNADSIKVWMQQHPKSALKELEKMTPSMQAKVANIATFIRSVNRKIDKKTAWREAAAIVHYCAKYNISTEITVGVAKTESNFNPELVSKAGARGVMQVMWKYHAGMLQAKGIAATQEQLLDPERGIESGILLLSRYVEAYGSIQKALNRYYGRVSETYAKKVDKNVAMLQSHSEKTGF